MTLSDYLAARGESQNAFSKRSGIPQRTVCRICADGVCSLRNAHRVVQATKADPAPDGGSVGFEDLVPARKKKRRAA